jgi:DnaJ-class molecular chaperone
VAGQFADYYSILGVDPAADLRAIRSAFRRLARRYHPDVAKGRHVVKRFLVIREAYDVLSDPEKRQEYDRLISKPVVASRPSDKRATAPGRRTAAPVEPSAPRRGFRLVVDALGILRLDLGVRFGGPSREQSRPHPSRAPGPRRRQE